MSTATPPIPSAEPTQSQCLSEPARLINIFVAPRKTFEDLKRNQSWWVPWLISAVFTILFAVVAVQKLDMRHLVQQRIDQSPSAQKRMEQLSPEQRDRAMGLQGTITKITFYVSPVINLMIGLVAAAILMAVFNFGFAAEVPFERAMAIVFYSFLPAGILATVLLSVSILVSADPNTIDFTANPMPTNPGFFMDPQGSRFLYGLASGIDVFRMWTVALLGLGFSAASPNRKLSAGTAITTMFVVYGILVLIGAGIRAAF
jgi:Yip1 domain